MIGAGPKNLIDDVAVTDRGKSVRYVEIEDQYHAEMQVGRYFSGLFAGWTPERFQEEVNAGFVTLTPSKEVHYKSHTFDIKNFIDLATTEQLDALRALIDTLQDNMPGVEFKPNGYDYILTVFGPKSFCEQKLVDIVGKWTQIAQPVESKYVSVPTKPEWASES